LTSSARRRQRAGHRLPAHRARQLVRRHAGNPAGDWPDGTGSNTHYLDEPDQDPFTAQFFRDCYTLITGEWQDLSDDPDDVGGSSIGDGSFVMNPDHPTSAPGTAHSREAHKNHMHTQISVTGTA
jgi:hypothetical protein